MPTEVVNSPSGPKRGEQQSIKQNQTQKTLRKWDVPDSNLIELSCAETRVLGLPIHFIISHMKGWFTLQPCRHVQLREGILFFFKRDIFQGKVTACDLEELIPHIKSLFALDLSPTQSLTVPNQGL